MSEISFENLRKKYKRKNVAFSIVNFLIKDQKIKIL